MAGNLVRVVLDLDPSEWHGNATERVWAEEVGSDRFRLRNSPFFAFGLSLDDVVFGSVEDDGQVHVRGISIRGGHSTYRLRLKVDRQSSAFSTFWAPLAQLGCSYEEGIVLAVDVLPGADIYAVYRLLEAGELAGIWDFDEGHCGHPLPAPQAN